MMYLRASATFIGSLVGIWAAILIAAWTGAFMMKVSVASVGMIVLACVGAVSTLMHAGGVTIRQINAEREDSGKRKRE